MDRTVRTQIQKCLPARPLMWLLLGLPLYHCASSPESLATGSLRLEPGQLARLTVRNAWFCAGQESLNVTLRFARADNETIMRKDAVLGCGDSAQLDFLAKRASESPVTARVEFSSDSSFANTPLLASVEVISHFGHGPESSVVYGLRSTTGRYWNRVD